MALAALARVIPMLRTSEFSLACISVCKNLLIDISLVKTSCKRRICHHQGIASVIIIVGRHSPRLCLYA